MRVKNKNKSKKNKTKSTDALAQDQRIRALLWQQLRHEWMSLTLGSVAMICSTAANQALPRLMGRFLDNNNSNNSNSTAAGSSSVDWKWIVVGGSLASLLRTTLLGRAEASMAQRLRHDAVQALLVRQDLQWFQSAAATSSSASDNHDDETTAGSSRRHEEKPTEKDADTSSSKPSAAAGTRDTTNTTTTALTPPVILQILDTDVACVAETWTTVWANLLRSLSAVTYSLVNMWRLDAGLLGMATAVIPVVGAAAMVLRRRVAAATAEQRNKSSQAASFVHERLHYLAVVRGAHRQKSEVQAYDGLLQAATAAQKTQALYQGGFMGFCFGTVSAAWLAIVHAGGQAVATGRVTHGQLTAFTTYSFLLGLGTSGLVQAMASATRGWVAARRYEQLVYVPPPSVGAEDEDKNKNATRKAIHTNGSSQQQANEDDSAATTNTTAVDISQVESIQLEKVSFAYQSSTGGPVLRNISLTVPRGQVVALVGKNGSGKSTLAHVLTGLYRPTMGQVNVVVSSNSNSNSNNNCHQDLATLSPATRSHLVQLVPQRSALFDMSILDNVRYAAPHATMAQVQAALTAANCQALVDGKKGGLDFVVGIQGHKLSGGEGQRLSLARALVADPAVLILDEPSAALDAEGASAVTEALTACRAANRGLVLITHQAKRLQEVDFILVLQQGEIVERGTFNELSQNPQSVLCQLYPDLTVSN